MDPPFYDVDLGSESLHQAAGFLGASQQGTCDGLRRLASASYGQMAALQSHAMASLSSRPSCHDGGSSSFGATSGGGIVPSGHVPGGGAAGRALKSLVGDSKRWTRLHLFQFVQGLSCKVQGLDCNFYFLEGLCVICISTAYN
jgi:hypothetical protein